MTGKMPEEGINPVEIPPVSAHVWGWFLQLNAERQSGMAPSPLTSQQVLAFFTLEGFMPEGWELLAIRSLDRVALDSSSTSD